MITELLLHAVTDVDAKAADQDYVYRTGKVWFSLDLQLCLLTRGGGGGSAECCGGWGGGRGRQKRESHAGSDHSAADHGPS